MKILAIDTALETCSAAVLDGERDSWRVLAARSEDMARGHQERLAPLVQEVVLESELEFENLDRLGVGVGPGSFTGLRVGLAFAKGLGEALGVPVVGVGDLEALGAQTAGFVAAVIDARRGQVYAQPFRDGAAVAEPRALAVEDLVDWLINIDASGPAALVGPGAPLLAKAFPQAALDPRGGPDPVILARLAAARTPQSPRPIYLRAPDAKLPASALSA